jgi:hypothetical protein
VRGKRVLFDTRRRQRVGLAWPRVRVLDDAAWALLEAIESPTPRGKLEQEWSLRTPLVPLLEQFLRDDWALEADGRVVRLVVIRQHPSAWAELRRVVTLKAKKLWQTRLRPLTGALTL